ncbi:DegT/DnrJ/EryC1/StrS family aminotransferase [Patescibacteria group bacterium]|nr:DegT/DnrJ/EryC1/StrS family aminotransferase [Patescibacteria group bacterium]
MLKIPLSQPDITEKEINSVVGVLKTPNLALGPKLKEFENKFAKYIGTKYAIAINSGTSGLHLLIRALGIKKGPASASHFAKTTRDKKATAGRDEVITSPFSFIASANCILYEGAKPIFVDIDPETLNIDPEKIEKAITKKTKAILAVDIFGHPADWDKILRIAKKHSLKVIEDSCEALGAEYKKKKCTINGD